MTISPKSHFKKIGILTIVSSLILILGISIGFFLSSKPQWASSQVQNQTVLQSPAQQYSPAPQTLAQNRQSAKVIRVIDGDTIELEGEQKVRYIGIDTPETVHPDIKVQCFGKEASDKNKELVEGKTIELEKDISETDKYGRLLRYVFVENPSTSSGPSVFINDYLVRQGFAHASTYPPDIKYQDQLRQAEQEAHQNNRGLWSSCAGQSNPPASAQISDTCNIKGNISTSGEKIYHLPGQRYYDKTVIDEARGERWFCTEEEAIAAGWRKSKI